MLRFFVFVQSFVARPLRSQRGATAVEYGLLVALIAAVIIGIVIVVGHQVSNAFCSVATGLHGPPASVIAPKVC
jgi:pilus assembly protein Flp/PilA